MDNIGKILQFVVVVGDKKIAFNVGTILMTWIVMVVCILFARAVTRGASLVPKSWQAIGELLYSAFRGMVMDALDEPYGSAYFPLIFSLFIFLCICNWIGIIPFFHEPTKDLNTPLCYGIMGFFIAHGTAIKIKGVKGYVKEYFQPLWFLFPLNIVSEIAKVISISFRLFGNIMGGSTIILVVSHLVYSLVLPPLLNLFFGLFVGTVQAFVFTILTLVYISVQIR
jgi:F-type H+-transporting ATPase subunit a